jgi:hypothetical protein
MRVTAPAAPGSKDKKPKKELKMTARLQVGHTYVTALKQQVVLQHPAQTLPVQPSLGSTEMFCLCQGLVQGPLPVGHCTPVAPPHVPCCNSCIPKVACPCLWCAAATADYCLMVVNPPLAPTNSTGAWSQVHPEAGGAAEGHL